MKKRIINTLKNQEGFSLIEIMIVVAIMGILIGLVGPRVMGSFEKAKVETTKITMNQLATTLKSYRLDCGLYPTTDQGLDALKTKPASGNECKNYAPGGYLDKPVPKDGWDRDFLYTSDGNTFEIKSLGKDRKEGGTDYDADLTVSDQQ